MGYLRRKFRIGERFVPKDENMFWKEYKIINYSTTQQGTSGNKDKLGHSYLVECYPKDPLTLDKRSMVIVEKTLETLMHGIDIKMEYKIKVLGEYAQKGIKVGITEKDKDSGLEFPYATASVWHENTPDLEENEFVLKNYSENRELESLLLIHGVIEHVGICVTVGYNECPVVRLTKKDTWYL